MAATTLAVISIYIFPVFCRCHLWFEFLSFLPILFSWPNLLVTSSIVDVKKLTILLLKMKFFGFIQIAIQKLKPLMVKYNLYMLIEFFTIYWLRLEIMDH